MTLTIAISCGDPAGIGPEVMLRVLAAPPAGARYQVYARSELFERVAARIGLSLPGDAVEWIETGEASDAEAVEPGESGDAAGRLQVASLRAALDAVLDGRAEAICTAPITKASAKAAGFAYPGHTEYLAERSGAARVAMMLAGPSLRVVPLTGHVALREVATRLTPRLTADGLELTAMALRRHFGCARPRVALAALNPHAGEQGMMGDEEERVLRPGLELARQALAGQGLEAELSGPHPVDGLFAKRGSHDAVVCCYHDQGLIPLKLLHRDEAVNVTLGLPIVRTSPAHGSALDIAWQGIARPGSMRAALEMAIAMAGRA
jgi:4-hydroxythreonine-4-phosphate dehydrogenase